MGPSKAPSIKGEKCRTKLFKFRAYDLPKMVEVLTVPAAKDMTIWQCVFEQHLCDQSRLPQLSESPRDYTLSAVEMNAVCYIYASVFVIRKLRGKYKKQGCSKACLFVECLDSIVSTSSDETEDADTDMELSQMWFKKTDREAYTRLQILDFVCFW